MFGRSVLGWLAMIAVNVVVILAGLWLLKDLIAQAPVLGTLLFVGVVLAALVLSIVVAQALTRQARGRPAPSPATGAGEPGASGTGPDAG
jgi:hypothetical protein